MLFTAAAYSGRFAELLASLPVDESVLSRTRGRFKERDRYLVVLTTPSDLPLNRIEQRLLPSFKGEADFVLPRLTFLGLEGLDEQLRTQYQAGHWAKDEGVKGIALDGVFRQEFLQFWEKNSLEWNIRALEKLSEPGGKDEYERQRQEKINQSFERKQGWPEPDQFFDQVLLFAAAFFSKVPIEDYSRIVNRLLGDANRTTAIPVRMLKRRDRETIVSEYKQVSLTNCWWDMRNSLVGQWGLRVTKFEGRYCVTAPDAPDIRRAFANRYPFTHMELWQRMLGAGLLFDESADVAKAFESLMVDRIREDPDHFGQDFLGYVLRSAELTGLSSQEEQELDFLGRFELLKAQEGHRFIIERIGFLMRAALDVDSRDLVANSLDQLILWHVPGIALQLLHKLTKLPIAKRLKLIRRVLHQSREPYWEDACSLVKAWLRTPADGIETARWMVSYFTPAASAPSDQSVAVAGAAMDVFTNWFAGPGQDGHKLIEFLGNEPADGLTVLVKLLFHPAFERARNQKIQIAFFGFWLLETHVQSATIDDKERLRDVQIALYSRFIDALSRHAAIGSRPIEIEDPPVVREYQATVIAEWMAALPDGESRHGAPCRKLLMETLAREVSEDLRRQLFVFWQAMDEASSSSQKEVPTGAKAALLRKITPTLQQGRRIFRQLLSDWVFQAEAAVSAASD